MRKILTMLRRFVFLHLIVSTHCSALELSFEGSPLKNEDEIRQSLEGITDADELVYSLQSFRLHNKNVRVVNGNLGLQVVIGDKEPEVNAYDADYIDQFWTPEAFDFKLEVKAGRYSRSLLNSLSRDGLYDKGEAQASESVMEDIELYSEGFLKKRGFIDAEVELQEIESKNSDEKLFALICERGAKSKIDQIKINGDIPNHLMAPVTEFAKELEGLVATFDNILLCKNKISDQFYKNGYSNHSVEYKFNALGAKRVELVFNINKMGRHRVDHFELKAPGWVNKDRLKKLIGIKSGDVAYFEGYSAARHFFETKGFAEKFSLTFDYKTSDLVDLKLEIEEKPTHYLSGGIYFDTFRRGYAAVNYVNNQIPVWFNGDKASFRASAVVGELSSNVEVKNSIYYFGQGGKINQLDLTMGYVDESYSSRYFNVSFPHAGVKYSHSLTKSLEWETNFEASRMSLDYSPELAGFSDQLDENYTRFELGTSMKHHLEKRFYGRMKLNLESELGVSSILSDLDDEYFKTQVATDIRFCLSEKIHTQFTFEFENLDTNGSEYLYDKLYLGGQKMKAFAYNAIGDQLGGSSFFYMEAKLERQIFGDFYAGVFAEAGKVSEGEWFKESAELHTDYGVSVSYKTKGGDFSAYYAKQDQKSDQTFSDRSGMFGVLFNTQF